MSNRPAARRTARCSSTMLEYCTGISHPPNGTRRAPALWWTANSGVRFNDGSIWFMRRLAPLLRFHLCLGHAQFVQHEFLGKFDQFIRTASVENCVRQIVDMLLHPWRIDAATAARPRIFRDQSRAGHVKVKILVLLFQFPEFFVEYDVVCRPDAVKHSDLCVQVAPRRFAHESPERRDARPARNANQMLVRLVNGQKLSRWRNHHHAVSRFRP